MKMNDFERQQEENLIQEIVAWKLRRPEESWESIDKSLLIVLDNAREFKENYPEDFINLKEKWISEARRIIELKTDFHGISAKHERWFSFDELYDSKYWSHFEQQMKSENWDKNRLEINRQQSIEIINQLSNPRRFDTSKEDAMRKGLVYGHVQSGKTAQMSSIISMYASCGCRLFIVFSGITNSLRNQTQSRFRKDLGIDKMGGWDLLTDSSDKLGKDDVCIEGKINGNNPVLGVFKKNPHVLRRLKDYLQNINSEIFWKNKTVLVIDDECDNASMNVARQFDDDGLATGKRSSINSLITDILNIFEKYCYVGFTATPFANVLNEKPGKDSLYPEDFIYPLTISSKYYSARKLFGSSNDNPDNPESLLDVVNFVETEEINPKSNDYADVPESLKNAIFYFILATACKYYRGFKNKHSSMLIHVDLKISTHAVVNKSVELFIENIKQNPSEFFSYMEKVWNSEKDRVPFEIIKQLFNYSEEDKEKYKIPDFNRLKDFILEVADKIETVVDNSSVPLEERLHYPDDESKVYIVIGGNTLSRGLTLEGLIVSYFYRTSKLYDTLLQMGRWFGYRIGYEDLPRIWTTERIAKNFSLLADVEDELQEQFTDYGNGLTPDEIAPRIRVLPLLQITRKLAMQNAKITGINYAGQRPSTLFFERTNKEWLLHNQIVTRDFLDGITQTPIEKNGNIIYQNIPISKIRQFIENYEICESNNACRKNLILKYFEKINSKKFLQNWNVAIIQNKKGREYQICSKLKVHLVNRSRLDPKSKNDSIANIKVLGQPQNMLVDTDIPDSEKDEFRPLKMFLQRHKYFEEKGIAEPGLLLIYPIDKDSKPKSNQTGRLPLDAVEDVVGITLVFPKDKNIELNSYMTISLDGVEHD